MNTLSEKIPRRPRGFRAKIFTALFGLLIIAVTGVVLGLLGRVERNARLEAFSVTWFLSEEIDILQRQISDLHRQFTLISQSSPAEGGAAQLPDAVRDQMEKSIAEVSSHIQRMQKVAGTEIAPALELTTRLVADWRHVMRFLEQDYVGAITRLVTDAAPRAEQLLEKDLPAAHNWLTEQLQRDQNQVTRLAENFDRILVLSLFIPLVLFTWISILVIRRVLGSLNIIATGVQTYARGDFSHRVDVPGDDEFSDAAKQINFMAEQSQQAQAAIGQLNTTLEAKVFERTRELMSSRESLAEAQRIAGIGSWELDLVRNHLVWSDEVFRIFELDATKFGASYEAFLEAIHPDDRARVNDAYTRSLQTREPYLITHRLKMEDGRIKYVEERCETEFDDAGKPLMSHGTIQDITGKVRAEEALREKDLINRQVIDTSLDAVVIIDDSGNIRDWNRQAEVMFGWRREDALGLSLDATIIPHKYREAHRAGMRHFLATGQGPVLNQRLELTALRRDGEEFPIELAISPMRVGERFNFSAFIRDLTSRKEGERERERLQEQLNQSQKLEAIGRLAGGVAHDFNNMLSVILGYTDMAAVRAAGNEAITTHLKEIRNAADRASGITRQLLAFARKQTVSPKVIDLNETIHSTFSVLRRLLGEDVELTWSPDENPQLVFVDPTQIDQLLVNLCVNARDSIEQSGRISIETGRAFFSEEDAADRTDIQAGDYVMMTVSDNGCGMDKETLAVIFEPFFTTKSKGTGLGLATVYGIVKQNKGFVNVYSEVGIGTTFSVYLPRAMQASASREEQPAAPAPAMSNKETILVVEDEPAILAMINEMLSSLDYNVLVAATPRLALELSSKTDHIDLLLSDVIMPEMNGRDLAIKLSAQRAGMKILFMSGYTSDFIDKHGVLESGVHFIQKPFSPVDLARKIREIL